MNSGVEKLLSLGLWYGIFCFVTGEINPIEWSTTAKVLIVIIGILVISND